jgi:hypothetical protein
LRVARLRRLDSLFGRIARDSEGGIAKSELGFETDESWRENATTFCGGIRPRGHFRFLDFGHLPPLLFSAAYKTSCNFLPLGMAIAEDHPDRTRFLLTTMRPREMDSSDMTEITLMSPGYIFVMYTDLV